MTLPKHIADLRDELATKAATMGCLATDFSEVDSIGFSCYQQGFDAGYLEAKKQTEILVQAFENIDDMPGGYEAAIREVAKDALASYRDEMGIE